VSVRPSIFNQPSLTFAACYTVREGRVPRARPRIETGEAAAETVRAGVLSPVQSAVCTRMTLTQAPYQEHMQTTTGPGVICLRVCVFNAGLRLRYCLWRLPPCMRERYSRTGAMHMPFPVSSVRKKKLKTAWMHMLATGSSSHRTQLAARPAAHVGSSIGRGPLKS
jgi:hypothetical protein